MRTILSLLLAGTFAIAADRPNIIVILTDDMGYSDLGCYGGEIPTPNLDALAKTGQRFTQFYNCARCCPTRASLLTGLYPHQAGVGHMMTDDGHPGYTGNLNPQCRTLAETLRGAGYRNYAVGKWHVTRQTAPDADKHNWPLQRGFDRFYGTIHGAGSYYDPSSLTRDNTAISAFADDQYKPATYYYTHAIRDHAVKFVADHAKDHAADPFFMYVAFTAAHWPMHALPEHIARHKGKYDAGYEAIRKTRFENAAKQGVIDAKQTLSPAAEAWGEVKNKPWESACMETYAAMIEQMDAGVGAIVEELKRTGKLDNTLILYLQDNGGCAELTGRTGTKNHPDIPRPATATLPVMKSTDFSTPGSTPAQTRDGFPVRMGPNAMPGPADTYVAYGRGWANVSNTPFREYKHWVHEGGISTPLIAHWPQGVTAKNPLPATPGHLVDIAATLYDVAGAKYTGAVPLEGKSLKPVFEGASITREAIYWEHEGNRAVRQGDWKLVAKHGKPWELYNISTDRVESQDLAATMNDKVQVLAALYAAYAKRANVAPWPVTKLKK